MKYLIVNVYDSCYGFSICHNGVVEPMDKWNTERNSELVADMYRIMNGGGYTSGLLEKYGNDYDLIILCEDGGTEVLKNDVKEGK